jgi:hypothetical protein
MSAATITHLAAARRVEAVDYGASGTAQLAVFVGGDAETRAREYAVWKYRTSTLRVSRPSPTLAPGRAAGLSRQQSDAPHTATASPDHASAPIRSGSSRAKSSACELSPQRA